MNVDIMWWLFAGTREIRGLQPFMAKIATIGL